jgi:hypothetical protein
MNYWTNIIDIIFLPRHTVCFLPFYLNHDWFKSFYLNQSKNFSIFYAKFNISSTKMVKNLYRWSRFIIRCRPRPAISIPQMLSSHHLISVSALPLQFVFIHNVKLLPTAWWLSKPIVCMYRHLLSWFLTLILNKFGIACKTEIGNIFIFLSLP